MPDNLSGVPPLVTLSGLNAGQGLGLNGPTPQSLAGPQTGATPGMTGGPDLLQLMLMQAGAGGAGDTGVGALTPFTQQAIGQQIGGLGAGAFGQQMGGTGGVVAGQTAGQQTGQGTSVDPLAILQKVLGLAQKGSGLLSQGQAGTSSPATGTSLSDQLRSAQGVPGQTDIPTASPTTGLQGIDPALLAFLQGTPGAAIPQQFLNQGLGGPTPFISNPYGPTGGAPFTPLTDFSQQGIQNFIQSLETGAPGSAEISMPPGPISSPVNNVPGGGLSGTAPEGGGAAGGVTGGITALLGLLNILQGAKGGSPGTIAQGVLGAAGGGAQVAQQVAPQATQQAVQALADYLGTTTDTLGNLAGYIPVVGMVISGLTDYFANQEAYQARASGAVNNPIRGALSSAATAGVGSDLGLLQQIQQAGGAGALPLDQLEAALPRLINQLGPSFATAQGGIGPIRASETATGTGQAGQYTANLQQAEQGVGDILSNLLSRGVTYEQLGQLPVSQDWAQSTLDLNNPLGQLFQAGNWATNPQTQALLQSAQQGLPSLSYGLTPGVLTPDLLFQAAQGAAGAAPNAVTQAGGLTGSMYGGPLWQAVARMGLGGPDLQAQIQQHFNPWAVIGGFTPQQLAMSLQPVLQPLQMAAAQREEAFTSGGG